MTVHTVADAKNHLPALIDRALAGESVVITRHGHPVVELRPISTAPRRVTKADLDWVAERRIAPANPVDAGALVSRMRDEDWR